MDDYRGNPKSVSDEGCPTGDHATRSVCQPGISGSREGWVTTASGEFRITELPHCKEEIDGGSKINSRSDPERRLDGHDRPKGCLSFGTSLGKASLLSGVLMGRAAVRIPVPSLWPVQCPQGILKAIETGDVSSEAERNPQSDLPRRYAGNEPVPDRTGNRDPGDPLSSPTSGIQDQLGKVPSLPIITKASGF